MGKTRFHRTRGKIPIRYWRENLKSLPNHWKKCIKCRKGSVKDHHLMCNNCWMKERFK